MKLRNDQLDALAQAAAVNRRREGIFALREHGFQVDEDLNTGALLVRDATGASAQVVSRDAEDVITTGEGRRFHLEYDKQGRTAALTDPAGLRVCFDHDEEGRLIKIKRGDHSVHRFDYDAAGRLMRMHFPDGTTSHQQYNALGKLGRVINRNGHTLEYRYFTDGTLSRVIDPAGHETRFLYEDWDSPATIVLPGGGRHGFAYTEDGGLKSMSLNAKDHASFRFDKSSGVREVRYHDGTWVRLRQRDDRLLEAANEHGTLIFDYDPQGRLIGENFEGQSVRYIRNAAGALTGIVLPTGERITYARDKEQRLSSVTDWNRGLYEISYNLVGTPAQIRYPNGLVQSMTATPMGLAESLTVKQPGLLKSALESSFWEYDLCDRVIGQTRNGENRRYRYDGEGRLQAAESNRTAESQVFELDPNGNRLYDGVHRCEYNGLNQLTQRGSDRFAYDPLGNLTEGPCPKGTATYEYNGRGQLIAANVRGLRLRYAYDAIGRRIRKEVGARITRYLWAGQQLLSETTNDGKTTLRRDYLYAAESPSPLAMRVNGRVFAIHPGRLAEPLCMTDEDGQVVWQADYDAFGEARVRVNTVPQPLRLVGQYFDDETGLHYNLARYYNPQLGRFLTQDPLRVEGGSWNFYVYCNGDPLNHVDPTGEVLPILAAIGIGIVVGAAVGAVIGGGVELVNQLTDDKPGVDGWAVAKEAGIGLLAGAVGGAFVASGPVGWALGGLLGAAGSVADYCVTSLLHGEEITLGGFLWNALIGGVIGAIAGPAAAFFLRRIAPKVATIAKRIFGKGGTELADEAGEKAAKEAAEKLAQQSDELDQVAKERAEQLVNTSSRRARGPVSCTVMDTKTGKVFHGQNSGVPDPLHPILEKRLDSYLEARGGNAADRAGVPGTHAEINALNEALIARERDLGRAVTEEELDEFLMQARYLDGRAPEVANRCPHCTVLTDGVTMVDE